MLKINGVELAVGVASISRSLRRLEKYRVTTEDGRTHSEEQARYLDFALGLGNFDKPVYDALFAELLPGGEVTVELDGEGYTGLFDSISDEALFEDADGIWWDSLKLSFTATKPLEVDDENILPV